MVQKAWASVKTVETDFIDLPHYKLHNEYNPSQ